MNKRIILILVAILLIVIPSKIYAIEINEIISPNMGLYDLTDDKLLYSKEYSQEHSIASLTKIMTTLVAIENIKDLNETVTITPQILATVRWDASIAGLKAGDVVTYEDLLYATILPSGADAANTLAISLSGSISNYVVLMNKKAEEIGLTNTHYINSTGLDAEGHISTVEDVIKLLKYALQNEEFKKVYTTKKYTLTNGLELKSTIRNYSLKLDRSTKRILGSKTGFTDNAGYCLSIYFKSNGHEFIYVSLGAVLGTDGYPTHLNDFLNIIDFMDENYNKQLLVKLGDVIKTIPVDYGKEDTYTIKSTKNVYKYLPIDYDTSKIKIEYTGENKITGLDNGKKIGEIKYYYEDELLDSEDVIVDGVKVNYIKLALYYKKATLIIASIIIAYLILSFGLLKKFTKRKKVVKRHSK